MKKFGFATVIASGLAAAILGFAAPAQAAPTGPGNAQDTISQLQADGYRVIVNRVGSTPLDQATVVAVRTGQTYSRTDSGVPGAATTSSRPSPARPSTWMSSNHSHSRGAPIRVPLFCLCPQPECRRG